MGGSHLPEEAKFNSNFAQTAEGKRLSKKLGDTSCSRLEHLVKQLEEEEGEYRKQLKAERISNWRHSIQTDYKARNAWLRRTDNDLVPVINHKGKQAFTRKDATKAIKEHWTEAWSSAKTISQVTLQEQQHVHSSIQHTNHRGQQQQEQRQREEERRGTQRPSVATLLQVAKEAWGANQWQASAIRQLPEAALEASWTLTERWEKAGSVVSCVIISRSSRSSHSSCLITFHICSSFSIKFIMLRHFMGFHYFPPFSIILLSIFMIFHILSLSTIF